MLDYHTLMAEHDRLVVQVTALEAAIDAGDGVAIHHAFATLSAELVAHLAKEDSMIYPRLIAGDDAETSAAAQEVVDEFRDLAADFGALIGWATQEAITAQPARFADEARGLLARLRGRVRRENELLYPQALRAAHIRLRG
jgi:iron-sulfur cluster repair protein YtfE (RIC family)